MVAAAQTMVTEARDRHEHAAKRAGDLTLHQQLFCLR
jgi:hypothetical protein